MDKRVEQPSGPVPAKPRIAGSKPNPPGGVKAKAPRRAPLKPRRPSLMRQLLRTAAVQGTAASLVASYLRFVNLTSRQVFDPPDPYGAYIHLAPVIFTMWHGQHFMLPFARIFDFDVRVLISRHHDGEINARVAEKLGVRTIRGSTARDPSRMLQKGGMVGFLEMKLALEEGACVSMTADISNLAPRRAGLGIVSLAKVSGRVIVPVAYATSRRIDAGSWDKATINLPFSRAVCAVAEPVAVPPDAGDELLEQKRRAVEDALNVATKRAYDLVDRRAG
jgi:lysophospholipid acyltransferase (LPLAT)-like uncharacterized protein